MLAESNCIPAFVKPAPRFDKVIVGFVVSATNLYQTSLVAAAPQLGAEIVIPVIVDKYMVPLVFTQLVEEVILGVVEHTLLTGAVRSTTQMLKFQSDAVPPTVVPLVKILIR